MTDLAKEIESLIQRYNREVNDMTRKQRVLPSGERALSRTHANVKSAAANELRRILDRCAVSAGARS